MKTCPKCGGLLATETDSFGPRLYCRICSYQLDLLAPSPQVLALTIEIGNLEGGVGGRPGGPAHDRPSGANHTKIERQINRNPKAGGYKPERK